MLKVIVVDNPQKWDIDIPGTEVISANDYLNEVWHKKNRDIRIFNLSDDYSYQSKGYYVSLVAEARGHRPRPDMKNIIDFKRQTLTKILSEDLDKLINKSLKDIVGEHFKLSVYFGKNTEKQYSELAREIHKLFRAPLSRAYFSRGKFGWELTRIKTIALKEVPENHLPLMKEFAKDFLGKKHFLQNKGQKYQYDLAILIDPKDQAPASNTKALQKFIDAGEKLGIYVELITSKDYNRLLTFDALFVRMTTHVNNYSYKFVRRAEAEGLAIIDYSENILKCGSKVFMEEVLKTGHIPIPKSSILYHDNWRENIHQLSYPCILKVPDSSFSFGVKKAEDETSLKAILMQMFQDSELVIAQEFVYTNFDWRVGVLDGEAIFVCKYYMAKGHWQIYNWDANLEDDQSGLVDTFFVEDAPKQVVSLALKACELFNKQGLFGVDIKEIEGKFYVIEVNDNPSIDYGCEDFALKDKLYLKIMSTFKSRIEGRFNHHNR